MDASSNGLVELIEEHQTEVKTLFKGQGDKLGALAEKATETDARLSDLEQKMVRGGRTRGGDVDTRSIGSRFVESDEFKALIGSSRQRGTVNLELKTVSPITTAAGSGQGLLVPEYDRTPAMLPRRVFPLRQLLNPTPTTANIIYFARQTVRNNSAAPVQEGALKPQSDFQFAQLTTPVVTIAHWVEASRQIMDDAPQLSSLVDSELTYGLDFVEENQLLNGDGTGQNLLGIIPQATAYSAPFSVTGETDIDRINLAIAQSEAALIPATGLVLHPLDWRKILGTKDGMGRYMGNGPFGGDQAKDIWSLNVATSFAMTPGQFLVGSFGIGAKLYDRMTTEILLSTEHSDFFTRNLIAIRGERRVGLAVKQPLAFITGTLPV